MGTDSVRMIIADDHETARAGIRYAFVERPDVEIVAEVSNGLELMQALGATSPNFLVVDLAMPDFEPLTAILNIRAQYPDLLILVVSAYADDIYVQGLLSAGVNGYHLKDQPLSDLTLAVDRILAGERWISSPLIRKLLNPEQRYGSLELSPRQISIARCLANGMSNKEIAEQLTLSVKTIENHLTRLYRQLNVNSRLEAATFIHDHPEILAQPGRVAVQEYPELQPPATNQTSILVVDDNKRYRKQLCGMVGKIFPQIMIYEASNWFEMQTIANQITPNVVFMDVVLGDEDGISCTWKLKQLVPSTNVILVSAYPDREFHRRGVESGAIAFVDKKDLDSATIKQIIEDTLTV
jgi:DNA-binding NarL/FixJ family response regulator